MSNLAAPRWSDALVGDLPVVAAARLVLRRRLRTVEKTIASAAAEGQARSDHAHQLRVATRRASAALRFFGDLIGEDASRDIARLLRRARRNAAAARLSDVQLLALENLRSGPERERFATAITIATVEGEAKREAAQQELVRGARAARLTALRGMRRRVLRSILRRAQRQAGNPNARRNATDGYTLAHLAREKLPTVLARLEDCEPLSDLARVHRLRIRAKQLRYSLELCAGCFPAAAREDVLNRVADLQARLGEINDATELAEWTAQLAAQRSDDTQATEREALMALEAEFAQQRDRLHTEFQQWWGQGGPREMLAQVRLLVQACCDDSHAARLARVTGMIAPSQRAAHQDAGHPGNGNGSAPPHWRVAAIDVGTNSVRLVVAESDALARFRVIDEVRETTRLGSGLYASGRLGREPVERTLQTLQHMRALVEGYHVDRLRAVGTSALREATDTPAFLDLARSRAGVEVEVIDADYEARLAFASVMNAFELEAKRFASVDLGGGSTEIVVSDGGLIESIHKLPLGAVRLTEMFGATGEGGGYRYGDMRRHVDKVIAEHFNRLPRRLELIVGSGGTFTSIAKMLIRRGTPASGGGRFPFALRGYEASQADVQSLLDQLRRLPLQERRGVPGLSERRAEIIVAGVCVVERLMNALEIERLWVHDGGIRDGLLTEMLDDLTVGATRSAAGARDALADVRMFAQRMRYDAAHSEHVTRLALRIFDQLAAQLPDAGGAWARREARDILHAAGILHDVGLAIAFPRHHKHSYDMIVNADLPHLTRREVELIAAVARAHRRSGPRECQKHFARLSADDQRLVLVLSGILRIADGLDRAHLQDVQDVIVHAEPHTICLDVRATAEPISGLKYAQRKSDVFAQAFHGAPTFTWTPAAGELHTNGNPV